MTLIALLTNIKDAAHLTTLHPQTTYKQYKKLRKLHLHAEKVLKHFIDLEPRKEPKT